MFIYVIEGSGDLRKIGRATNPTRRLGHLSAGSAIPLRVCHQFAVEPHEGAPVERFTHWLLRGQRQHGEWFRVSKSEALTAIAAAAEAVRRGEKPGPARVPRDKEFPIRITLPLTVEMTKAADAALQPKEARVELIRKAIARELTRRERESKRKP